jgi:hypothetical protein
MWTAPGETGEGHEMKGGVNVRYERPGYLAEGVAVTEFSMSMFGGGKVTAPVPERPISVRENFKRAARRKNPVWAPISITDVRSEMIANLTGAGECDWTRKERYDWKDWFDVEWTFVPEAGGPMLKTGTQYLDDILNYKTGVKFPNLAEYDIEGLCGKFMKTYNHQEKVLHVNIGLGCTERLVSLLGGYTEAMTALAVEPEAVRAFLEDFVDFEMTVVDALTKYLPIDFITYHDDWGTERDTFFGERMMEEIVFPPTKRLFDHIKAKDIVLQLHSCGRIGRFIPYMIDLGVDFLQIQERANDIPSYKEKWGDKIGFEVMCAPDGEGADGIIRGVRKCVDTYAGGGGFLSSVFSPDPEIMWAGIMELFYYSREKYESELGG